MKPFVLFTPRQATRKSAVLPLALLLVAATWCGAQPAVQQAMQTLRTNLDSRARQEAFRVLREQKQLPSSGGVELGRIVTAGGPEAPTAAGLLPRLGNAALPIITKLMESPGPMDHYFDFWMHLSHTASGWDQSNEMAYVQAMLPFLHQRPGYKAALMLSALPVSVTNAAALTRELLKLNSYPVHALAATRVAEKACGYEMRTGDVAVFQEMQRGKHAIVQYAGALCEETVMALRWNGGRHVPPRLTPEETARREKVKDRLRELAAQALTEGLDEAKRARGDFDCMGVHHALQFIVQHAQTEPEQRKAIAAGLRQMVGWNHMPRGSLVDDMIDQLITECEREPRR